MQAYYLPGVSRLLLSAVDEKYADQGPDRAEAAREVWFGDAHVVRHEGVLYIGTGVATAFFALADPGAGSDWVPEAFRSDEDLSNTFEPLIASKHLPTSDRDVFVPYEVVALMFQALERDGRVVPLVPFNVWGAELLFDLRAIEAPDTPETLQ